MGTINACVDLRLDDGVAIVTIDNPPVNAIKREVRVGLVDALGRIREDASAKAAVLSCAGSTFTAGADITEFGTPAQLQPPNLLDVIATIDGFPKPVVAAMQGAVLGGGLEIALSCTHRIAAPGTRFGLPEVKLGLIPGAGGTQRLPRLVGVEPALRMIVSGDPIAADEALRIGLVDALIPAGAELVAEAVAFARRVVAEGRPLRRVREMTDAIVAAKAAPRLFEDAVAAAKKRARAGGKRAPLACVEAVRAALDLPFEEGLALERRLFLELQAGDESKALRHVFFAEREAAKVPDMPKGTAPRRIERAVVLGAGTMGGGIAMCFANAGIPVTVVETAQDALDRGLDRVMSNYRTSVSRGGLAADEMERRVALIAGSTDFDAVATADIVIEAVFEEMDLKKRVFADLDRLARPGALLATNTSTLDVDEIAAVTSRPGDVLGMHFFSPANVMRLLEIVRGAATSFDALATAIAVAKRLGKVPVTVGVCDGFVGNRMLARRSAESEKLLLEGALPQEVDAAVTEFGFPMGPFAMYDLAGLDVGMRIRRARGIVAPVSDALCDAGRYGQKTGAGYFRYESGSRAPLADPEVERIVVETSARLGLARRTIPRDEIVERMIFPMINEAARILDEGIATRPGDVDVVWVYGYGWPAWRGGPMFYADAVGLPYIRDRLAEYAVRSQDPTLEPAPLLVRLAAEGRGFGSLRAAAGGGSAR
jgi:3-hydroxyacyl-CoA dehydrogenase